MKSAAAFSKVLRGIREAPLATRIWLLKYIGRTYRATCGVQAAAALARFHPAAKMAGPKSENDYPIAARTGRAEEALDANDRDRGFGQDCALAFDVLYGIPRRSRPTASVVIFGTTLVDWYPGILAEEKKEAQRRVLRGVKPGGTGRNRCLSGSRARPSSR
jgi:hypothetical protein